MEQVDGMEPLHGLDATSPLCGGCQSLDMDRFFDGALIRFEQQNRIQNRPTIMTMPDGTTKFVDTLIIHNFGDRLAQESTCPLCTFFRAMRVQPGLHSKYQLKVFPSTESWMFYLESLQEFMPPDVDYVDAVCMAVIPDLGPRSFGENIEMMEKRVPEAGVFYRLKADESRDASSDVLVRPRELQDQVAIPVAAHWLNFCRTHHREACERPASHEPVDRGFRLIDCTASPPTFAPQPWGTPYAALSYVWGASADDNVPWPRTVLDAVAVTKELGMRYLWVDRLCIDQSNAEEKQYLINKMTTIYQCADITLFATAGSGASHGLPGVRPTPRNVQPRYVLDSGSTLVSIMRDPRNDILESAHWTRGWTYQEGVLSNRRLVFTENQMYWECNNMATQESLAMSLWHYRPMHLDLDGSGEETHQQPSVMAEFMLGGIFKGNSFTGSPPGGNQPIISSDTDNHQRNFAPPPPEVTPLAQFRGINEHIRDYSRRRLTHDSDGLNAFLGITNAYRARFPEFALLQGLPLWTGPVAGGGFSGAQITFGLAVTAWYHLGSGVQTWFAAEPCRRRTQFPSWSWAGWDAGAAGSAVTWRSPPQFEHAAVAAGLIECEREDAWPLWAAEVHLCSREQFVGERPPARTIRLRGCLDGKALSEGGPDTILLQNPWVLRYFNRVLVDEDRAPGKTFTWVSMEGRAGRPNVTTDAGVGWDQKRYRIAGRLSYVGLSVEMTEREWQDKHFSGELVSVLMFASRYPGEENSGHGTAKFLTVRKAPGVLGRWRRWERVGSLSMIIPKVTLDKCDTEEMFLKQLPVGVREGPFII
ncbi:heterokaryon incompatibility protein-domain-containing protein, partial [Podospora conica]